MDGTIAPKSPIGWPYVYSTEENSRIPKASETPKPRKPKSFREKPLEICETGDGFQALGRLCSRLIIITNSQAARVWFREI